MSYNRGYFLVLLLQVCMTYGRNDPKFVLKSDVEMANAGLLTKPVVLFESSKVKCVHACNQLSSTQSYDVNMRSYDAKTGRCGCYLIPVRQFVDSRDTHLEMKRKTYVLDGEWFFRKNIQCAQLNVLKIRRIFSVNSLPPVVTRILNFDSHPSAIELFPDWWIFIGALLKQYAACYFAYTSWYGGV